MYCSNMYPTRFSQRRIIDARDVHRCSYSFHHQRDSNSCRPPLLLFHSAPSCRFNSGSTPNSPTLARLVVCLSHPHFLIWLWNLHAYQRILFCSWKPRQYSLWVFFYPLIQQLGYSLSLDRSRQEKQARYLDGQSWHLLQVDTNVNAEPV